MNTGSLCCTPETNAICQELVLVINYPTFQASKGMALGRRQESEIHVRNTEREISQKYYHITPTTEQASC